MKYTLLELTQSILSALNSDEVNSIHDTVESRQIAEIIKTSYVNLLGRCDLPEHNQLFQLNPSLDDDKPVVMYRPDGVQRIEWLKYFNNLDITSTSDLSTIRLVPGYQDVQVISPEAFIQMMSGFNPLESNVDSFDLTVDESLGYPNTFTFYYKNDRQPSFCTIISNYYIIFDSYDKTLDSTLQGHKTMAYGWIMPVFRMDDNYVPNLDEQQFPILLNESKSLAFLELKQQVHQKAEHEVTRQLSSLQKFKALANKPTPFEQLPNFGRC